MQKIILIVILLFSINILIGQSVIIKDAASDTLVVVEDNGDVGIGTTNPKGALEITSTTGGLIVPRMTTGQRTSLPNVSGTIIYNTTTGVFNFNESGSWVTKLNE